MTSITVFKSERCGSCVELVPVIKRMAKKKGIEVSLVDVDKCKSDKCNGVKMLPTVEINGKRVSLKALAKMLK